MKNTIPKKIPLLFSRPKKIPASFIDPKKSLLAKMSDPKKSFGPPVIKICEWGPWESQAFDTVFHHQVKHLEVSTLLAVFHLVMKHCVSCLIYYLKTWLYGSNYNSGKGEHAFLKVTNNVRFMFCTQRHACTMRWLLIQTTENFTKKNPFLNSTIKNLPKGFP